jgi:hypothetical protein
LEALYRVWSEETMSFIGKPIKVPITISVGESSITSNLGDISISCGFYDNGQVRIQLENNIVIETTENSGLYLAVRHEIDKWLEEEEFDKRVTKIVKRELRRIKNV